MNDTISTTTTTYRILVDGSLWTNGVTAAELTAEVGRAAAAHAAEVMNARLDYEVESDAAAVEVDGSEDGAPVGTWPVRVTIGHQGYEREEFWGISVSRPEWVVDDEEIVYVTVESDAAAGSAVSL